MEPISSVQELIECFDDADPLEQAKIIKNIDIPLEEYEEYASWRSDCYTRNCLARTEDYEFILLCWDDNCDTPIHDHAGQNCWVRQVDGVLQETRYSGNAEDLNIESVGDLNPGQISYMNDELGYHKIANVSGDKAMTLHVYVKPIEECMVWNDEKEDFEMKQMEYDNIHQIEA